MRPLTAAEIAAFLGVTATAVRSIVHRKQVRPVGKTGRANLYDPRDILRHAGTHDRRSA
jgi:chromosome segregation and condensation protein ScpB